MQSMEEEAERVYEDERRLLLDDEAAFARDSMLVLTLNYTEFILRYSFI